jgi:hypothetical protein
VHFGGEGVDAGAVVAKEDETLQSDSIAATRECRHYGIERSSLTVDNISPFADRKTSA